MTIIFCDFTYYNWVQPMQTTYGLSQANLN
jgi:hypothetical protein